MCNHFATAPFALFIFDGGGLSNTFIYLFYLKTSKPQNLKTSLCSITTVSVSYADTLV